MKIVDFLILCVLIVDFCFFIKKISVKSVNVNCRQIGRGGGGGYRYRLYILQIFLF